MRDIQFHPVVDSIVIWQNIKVARRIGLVTAKKFSCVGIVFKVITDSSCKSIEGNTNDAGGREGYIVAEKQRTTLKKEDGLNVLGFINLIKEQSHI
jgi:hypothetical protein